MKTRIAPKLYQKYQKLLRELKSIGWGDYKTRVAKEREILALSKTVKGHTPGRIIRFQEADGYAYYLLTEYDDDICRVEYLSDMCEYKSPSVTSSGKIFTETVKTFLDWQDALERTFKK